jgi:hypothetical protein
MLIHQSDDVLNKSKLAYVFRHTNIFMRFNEVKLRLGRSDVTDNQNKGYILAVTTYEVRGTVQVFETTHNFGHRVWQDFMAAGMT